MLVTAAVMSVMMDLMSAAVISVMMDLMSAAALRSSQDRFHLMRLEDVGEISRGEQRVHHLGEASRHPIGRRPPPHPTPGPPPAFS